MACKVNDVYTGLWKLRWDAYTETITTRRAEVCTMLTAKTAPSPFPATEFRYLPLKKT